MIRSPFLLCNYACAKHRFAIEERGSLVYCVQVFGDTSKGINRLVPTLSAHCKKYQIGDCMVIFINENYYNVYI